MDVTAALSGLPRSAPPPALAAAGRGAEGIDPAERALVERARTDRQAFARLYRQHYAAIGAYLYRRTGSVHVTEDLLAETFLAALKALPRFRPGRAPFRAWLYRIATNGANRWARRNRRRATLPLSAAEGRAAAPQDPRAEDTEALRRALAALPPAQQAVVVLHHVEGLPVAEVAEVVGCRAGTVKSRLARAREALRVALERRI